MKRGARQSPTEVIAISYNNGRGLPRLAFRNVIGGLRCLLPVGTLFLPPSVLPIHREKACYKVFKVSCWFIVIGCLLRFARRSLKGAHVSAKASIYGSKHQQRPARLRSGIH